MLTASVLFSYKPSFALRILPHAVVRGNIRMAELGQGVCRCRLTPCPFLQVQLWREGDGYGGFEPSMLIDEANPHCILILARAAVSVRKVTND